MSAKVDQFCDMLRDRLNSIEGGLEAAKVNLKSRSEEAEKVVRGKLDEVRSKLHTQKERVEQTRAKLKVSAQQKIAETKEAVSQWKAKHDTQKLQARAERAEAYAADAIAYSLATLDETEEAILEAVVARMDADAAYGGTVTR